MDFILWCILSNLSSPVGLGLIASAPCIVSSSIGSLGVEVYGRFRERLLTEMYVLDVFLGDAVAWDRSYARFFRLLMGDNQRVELYFMLELVDSLRDHEWNFLLMCIFSKSSCLTPCSKSFFEAPISSFTFE